jgi:hypothetical protein
VSPFVAPVGAHRPQHPPVQRGGLPPGPPQSATLTVEIFPGTDHRLRLTGTRFAPEYLTTLARWLQGQTSIHSDD